MEKTYACPQCGTLYSISDDLIGIPLECSNCQTTFIIPSNLLDEKNNHSIEEIRQLVGVDTLGYLDLNDLKQIATCGGKNSFCYACFDGKYSTDIPQEQPVNKYETKINIEEKTKRH
jgi:hypothetical protein